MNLVVLGPREVVIPSGCPGIRRRLDALGVVTHELEIGEYINAAGGLGCLVGILSRAAT
jgi:N-dimethylarginine dimethylaminohydrolase